MDKHSLGIYFPPDYKAAGDVLECWEVDAPEEFIDAILHSLG